MKIIHIIPSLGNGGAERLVVDLCSELSKTNEVIICSFRNTDGSMFYIDEINPKVRVVTFGKTKGPDIKLPFKIQHFLKKEMPDVVNSHLSSAFPYILLSILTLSTIKFFHTIHNIPGIEEPRALVRKIRSWLILNKKLHIIAISDEIGKEFTKLYKTQAIEVIYNGRYDIKKSDHFDSVAMEIDAYKPDKDTKVFISIGRLSDQKNYGLLINTFKHLYTTKSNVILLIIGDDNGTGLKTIYEKEKSFNTFLLGSKNNISDYLINSDYFCLSSIYEGLPIAVLEALSVGLPVVTTNVGGIPDVIINEVNGFLTPVDDDKYLEAICRCLQLDAEQLIIMKSKNRELFVNKYSIENTARNYLLAYKSEK